MVSSSAVCGSIRARSFALRRPVPPPGMPRCSVWSAVARNVRFWRKIGVLADLAPRARGHAGARGGIRTTTWAGGGAFSLRSNRTQPEGKRPPCYYPRRHESSESRGRAAPWKYRANANAAGVARHEIQISHLTKDEGTQTPADCALTAPFIQRTNRRPSLLRLRGIGFN